MCNLYSLTRNRDTIVRLFRVPHNRAAAFAPLPAIFPGHQAPVLRLAEDGERELVLLSWGLVLLQHGRAPRRVTNVRDDKVRTSAFWRPSFEQRRCLVPASSFCEPKGSDARPLFAFPGLWRRYRGPLKKNGEPTELDVFAFMTTTPNALVATINHERMPVLLTGEDQFETWLHGSPAAAFALARQHPAEAIRIVQSGAEKEDWLAA
jgi:putative SOS response-associated peptidase YedK